MVMLPIIPAGILPRVQPPTNNSNDRLTNDIKKIINELEKVLKNPQFSESLKSSLRDIIKGLNEITPKIKPNYDPLMS